MARYKGHEGSASAGTDPIGEIESFDLEHSVQELDANIMGSAWTNVEAGQASMSGTVNVLRDPDNAGQTALVVGDTVSMLLYPEGETTSLTEISGDFLVTGDSISVSVGDLVKDSYTIRNKGAVTIGTVT
mgnify:CR=1 FL=1